MKTMAIFNLKGGVGKTMTTASLADSLVHDQGKRVLLIDADAQGNLSMYFGVRADDSNSTLALLAGKKGPDYGDFVSRTNRPDIDIIPADMTLINSDLGGGKINLRAIAELRDAIAEDARYDYILIDCPPSFSAASSAALMAADEVIIPVRCDRYSIFGMSDLLVQVKGMRKLNSKLSVGGVLITQYQRTKEEDEAIGALKKLLPVYESPIRYSKRVSAATYSRESLIEFSPTCAATRDYRRFAAEIVRKDGGRHE